MADVGQRLGDHVVGGDLDRLGQPPRHLHVEADGDGGAAGQRPERRAQPALGEDRRVDAAGDLAQLLQHVVHLGDRALQPLGQLAGSGRRRRLRLPQLQGEGDQPLLGAVVQIALDAPARLVGGGHDPRPGGGQRGLRLGVGDRGGDQLGEAGQPRLGVRRQRLLRADATIMTPHSRPSTLIGTPTAERTPAARGRCRRPRRGVAVVVDPRRPAGLEHQRDARSARRGSTGCRPRRPGAPVLVHVPTIVAVPSGSYRLMTVHVGGEQPPGLRGDRGEHLLRRRRPGHQRRHPPQRRLLLGEPAQLHARLGVGDRGARPAR